MPAQSDRPSGALSLAERKKLLALVCAADRAAWIRSCQPADEGPIANLANRILHWADMAGAVMPGRIGRLLRGTSFFAKVVRNVTGLRRNGAY